jgi:glycosyltransferase involved in cell wall biosynthesis
MQVIPMPSARSPSTVNKILIRVCFPLWCIIQSRIIHRKEGFQAIFTAHVFDHLIGFFTKMFTRTKWVIDAIHLPYFHLDLARVNRKPLLFLRGLRTVLIAKIILRYVDFALVVAHSKSEGYAKIFTNEFHIEEKKVLAVPGGVDLGLIEKLRGVPKRRRNSEEYDFRILYVGSISPNKARELIYCINLLKDKIFNVKLTLIGPTVRGFEQSLLAELTSLNLRRYVEITGRVAHDEVIKLMEAADVCVNSMNATIRDYQYAHPGKILEYMALGKAVVATDTGGTRGIIEDRHSGLLYENGNIVDMANKIHEIYSNKALSKMLAENALKKVKSFDWRVINLKWNRVLQQVIQSS